MKNQTYRMTMLFDFYGELLTDRQKEFFDLYYNEDLSLSEIAENEGISRQGVRDSIKRAEAQMLEMEERLGLSRRFREMCAQAQEIGQLAQEIRQVSDFPGAPGEIGQHAARIAALADQLQKTV